MGYGDKARTLVKIIKALDAETAEQIARLYLEDARRDGRDDTQIVKVPMRIDPWLPDASEVTPGPIWQVLPDYTSVTGSSVTDSEGE